MDRLARPQPVTATRRLDAWRQRVAGSQLVAQATKRDTQQAGDFFIVVVRACIVIVFHRHVETPLVYLRTLSCHKKYHDDLQGNYGKPYTVVKGNYGDAKKMTPDETTQGGGRQNFCHTHVTLPTKFSVI
jgi:hypothetical protein